MRPKRISLTQHLIEENRRYGTVPEELRLLLEVVCRACKIISHSVGKGALGNILGSNETQNVQGEVQKKLDVLSNEILLESNEWGGYLAAVASEEMETIHPISKTYPHGKYLLLFDPLDGSSNIDVNGITSDRVEVKYILHLDCHDVQLASEALVTQVEQEPAEEAEPGILMYFSQPGESLWDIAKRYRVSCDSLKRMNPDLEEDGSTQAQRVILWRK